MSTPSSLEVQLFKAIELGHAHEAQQLLDQGADIHARWESDGQTAPLEFAVVHNQPVLFDLLLKSGARIKWINKPHIHIEND